MSEEGRGECGWVGEGATARGTDEGGRETECAAARMAEEKRRRDEKCDGALEKKRKETSVPRCRP